MSWIRNILLLIFVSIISIKISDFVFSYIVVPESNLVGSSRSIVLREFSKPGSYYVIPTDEYMNGVINLEKKKYKLTVNNDGFITPKQNLHNKSVDVIFLGGSTTETLFVEENQRFPVLVGELMSQRLDRDIYTLNGGVSGNNSLHSNLVLISKGLKYNPKFVVLMHNVNDWSLLSKTGSYFNAPDSRKIIGTQRSLAYQISRALKDFLIPNSYFYIKVVIDNYLKENSNDEFFGYDRFSVELSDIKSTFKSSIVSFVEVSKAWGINPILMTQMSRSMGKKDFEYQNSFNNIVRNIGKQYDVLVIDLDKELSEKEEYIYDNVHLNTNGSKKAASIITEAILSAYPSM
jgi:hypothetical protein